jgi:hypothetical protein
MKKFVLVTILGILALSGFCQTRMSDFPLLLGRGDSMSVPVLVPSGLNYTNRRMYGRDLAYGKVDSIIISNDSVYEINWGRKIFRGISKGALLNLQDSLRNYGFYTFLPLHLADGGLNHQDSLFIDTVQSGVNAHAGILLPSDYVNFQTAYSWGNHAAAGYLTNGYASITDGSNTATSTGATSFKIRTGANNILSAVVTNNDPTHGDNVLLSIIPANITIGESQVTSLTTDLSAKASLASPGFTGVPTAPTASNGTNTTQLATTAFVQNALSTVGGGTVTQVTSGNASPLFSTLVLNPTTTPAISYSLTSAAAHSFWGNNTGASAAPGYVSISTADLPSLPESQITNLTSDLNLKAPLASPSFTGTPLAPTAAVGTNNTQIATTAFVQSAMASAGSGTVTNVSVGNIAGFFIASVANPSTTPSVTFALSNAAAHTFWGNNTGSGAAPSYVSITAADVPTLNQNTTGSAGSVSGTNVISNSNLSQMGANTLKGNNTGSTANATDLTATQVTAMLNLFTSSLKGLVPSSGGGTTNYLRADGAWGAPPGIGDITGGASLGTGVALYYDKSGNNLRFNSITNGVGTTVSMASNTITVGDNAYINKGRYDLNTTNSTKTTTINLPLTDNASNCYDIDVEAFGSGNEYYKRHVEISVQKISGGANQYDATDVVSAKGSLKTTYSGDITWNTSGGTLNVTVNQGTNTSNVGWGIIYKQNRAMLGL